MTAATILTLLTLFATFTALITEGVKKILDSLKVKYASNVLVLFVALIVGCGGTALYYVNYQVPFTALNSVYLALMGLGNWLGSMVGYDKVKQAVSQLGACRLK